MTVSDLIHDSRGVFDRLRRAGRLPVTNRGRLVAYLEAPASDEAQMEQWVADGTAPADWAERQQRARTLLTDSAPVRVGDPATRPATTALQGDREDNDR